MVGIRQQVEQGRVGRGGHGDEIAMVGDSGRDDVVIASEGPGDVLGRLARAEPDFLLLDVDRMAAQLDDGHLDRVAGARRRLLEDQGDALAVERPAKVAALGQVQDLGEVVAAQVGDAEQVPHQSASLLTMVPMPSSVSSSMSKAWATRPSMMWAVPTPPSTASAQALSFGIMPAPTL